MKFVLFLEGDTEHKVVPAFLKRWLDPKLKAPVGIKGVNMGGWPEYIKEVPKKALMYLHGPDHDDIIAAIGLLDLYGPTVYPAHLATAEERTSWLVQTMETNVGHPRFRQFAAVHELEAWLLADPRLFPPEVAKALPASVAHPETINSNRPPAKLLGELYEEKAHTDYKKVTNGSVLFAKLDPQKAYATCPNLKALLDEMLYLAQQAGL
ncbi:MAG TPA: DUF4276 family protein [Symbiobacteriaceae bacterium]|jgi:hypothetical protein